MIPVKDLAKYDVIPSKEEEEEEEDVCRDDLEFEPAMAFTGNVLKARVTTLALVYVMFVAEAYVV